MIQLAAFWKRESKNNRVYYTGRLGNGRLLLFKNENKETEKQPDLILYIVQENASQNGQTKTETNEDSSAVLS